MTLSAVMGEDMEASPTALKAQVPCRLPKGHAHEARRIRRASVRRDSGRADCRLRYWLIVADHSPLRVPKPSQHQVTVPLT
jgi:hypothetical protein